MIVMMYVSSGFKESARSEELALYKERQRMKLETLHLSARNATFIITIIVVVTMNASCGMLFFLHVYNLPNKVNDHVVYPGTSCIINLLHFVRKLEKFLPDGYCLAG